jgi:5-methylcytosine-specific restriction protein A
VTRDVPEWIGATPDTPIPPRVKARVFARYKGECYIAKRAIRAGEPWDCDHVKALCNGGENREGNLAPVLRDKHREKTARDVAEKSDVYERRLRHLGLKERSRSWGDPKMKRKVNGRVVPR